jgi:hypothetical protein
MHKRGVKGAIVEREGVHVSLLEANVLDSLGGCGGPRQAEPIGEGIDADDPLKCAGLGETPPRKWRCRDCRYCRHGGCSGPKVSRFLHL